MGDVFCPVTGSFHSLARSARGASTVAGASTCSLLQLPRNLSALGGTPLPGQGVPGLGVAMASSFEGSSPGRWEIANHDFLELGHPQTRFPVCGIFPESWAAFAPPTCGSTELRNLTLPTNNPRASGRLKDR